jgi:fructokinase
MIRIGVDFGGTKIEAAAIDEAGRFLARIRRPNPRVYEAALQAVVELVAEAEAEAQSGPCERIGVAAPGSVSPRSGDLRNANSTWLNGRPFRSDLEAALGRAVRLANDANCLALSEAVDGAAAGAKVAFAMILGTGCGAGIAVGARAVDGLNGIAGEVGHTPLPWPTPAETPGPDCWCGLKGCLETYISGTGLERDYRSATGAALSSPQIIEAARGGEAQAQAALDRYVDRLARGLAVVTDLIDPDVIVLGGGMSNVDELYQRLPGQIAPYVFSDVFETPIVKALHGDSSGVRGAAWLWPPESEA